MPRYDARIVNASQMVRLTLPLALGCSLAAAPRPPKTNATVERILSEVSAENIAAILRKLESFETRNTFSDVYTEGRGIGAARQWIFEELRRYSPRLQVRYDSYHVKKKGRVFRNVEIVNVVAVLPGTTQADEHVVVSAHYDSLNLEKADLPPDAPRYLRRERDPEKIVAAYAPGVVDDGSGTAAVLELARVMSRHKFKKSIVFVAFAAEEQGLVGSNLFAARAAEDKVRIEAVFNNDIIGSVAAGDGSTADDRVRVFAAGPEDSMSRQLVRYIREMGERYLPKFQADMIFRADRFGRGGDHTSFNQRGYAAVRFTTPMENYDNQHTPTDLISGASAEYTARVARLNAAGIASLALAPPRPAASFNRRPLISRGASGYDAVLAWECSLLAEDLAGYAVVMRKTTDADWQDEVWVGVEGERRFPKMSIDEWTFGVKAIDREGNESLVSPYVFPTRRRVDYELY